MSTHRPAPRARALTLASRVFSVLAVFVMLAGCGTGGSPTSSAPSGGTAATAGGAASTTSDISAFVPKAPDAETAPRDENGQLKVIVTFKGPATGIAGEGVASKVGSSLVAAKGGTVKSQYHIINGLAASVPDSALSALRADPRVASVEPDLPVYAAGVELDTAWGVRLSGAGGAHATGNQGAGIKVAILDTGIDYRHPDLAECYAGGYNFVNASRKNDPMDDNGHGTHVAGIVAGRDDNAGVVGVAPKARVYAVKVLALTGAGANSDIIKGLQWCVDNKMQVANLSLGSRSYPGAAFENACKAATAAGVILVCAAGNSGAGPNTVDFPAGFDGCIAVGAVDALGARAVFSSTGPKVEVAAPGVAVVSCKRGGGYVSMSGTSMAAPHVAGAVALALAAGFSPADIRQRLQTSGRDVGAAGRDPEFGFGLLRIPQLLGLTIDSAPDVRILAPVPGEVMSSRLPVRFSGYAIDLEEGNMSSTITWTVNGVSYGSGAEVTATLEPGTYTAIASVTDASGNVGSSAPLTFTVGNAAPQVKIVSPSGGKTPQGVTIRFQGTASDPEDGNLTARMVWKVGSKIIGTGGSLSSNTLAQGTYTVTASVTDAGGKTTTASVSLTVSPPLLDVAVTPDKAAYASTETGRFAIRVTSLGRVVSGARLVVTVLGTRTPRPEYRAIGKSATDGTASSSFTFDTGRDGAGSYMICVSASKSGFTDYMTVRSFDVQ